jgi:two-component system LytT family response regulator
VPADAQPVIVFITAHSQFAVDAFETSAADYLLKPFDQTRFDRAIDRARRVLGRSSTAPVPVPRRAGRERFAVKRRGEILFVRTSDIDWFEAEGNYVRIHTGGKSYLVRESLQSLDESLDPSAFLRVHRSAIVNIERVKKIVSTREGGTSIVLGDGGLVPVGPAYRDRLHEVFGDPV